MAKIGLAIAALVVIVVLVALSFNLKSIDDFRLLKKDPTVTVNNKVFKVEVADDQTERALGLSGREALAEEKGMLFLFEKPGYYSFWMKNMKFPLDIIFINEDKIVTVVNNALPQSAENTNNNASLYQPTERANKVLETNAGLAQKYNLKKGDTVKITL